jgi:hypothetical protein
MILDFLHDDVVWSPTEDDVRRLLVALVWANHGFLSPRTVDSLLVWATEWLLRAAPEETPRAYREHRALLNFLRQQGMLSRRRPSSEAAAPLPAALRGAPGREPVSCSGRG